MSIAPPPALDAWFRSPQTPAARIRAADARTSIVARWSAKVIRKLTLRARSGWPLTLPLDAHRGLLVDRFAPLREQARAVLQAAGMTLAWTSGDGVDTLPLATHARQGLLLVAQEALDAMLRQNPEPRVIHLELEHLHGETGSHLRMAVIDTAPSASRSPWQAPVRVSGLSMAQRHATQLGAQLDIDAHRNGWCVELVLQLAPA